MFSFDQKPFLFDQKLFYSTKSCVYSTKNCSIRPKAVSIRPKIHSFDQKPSPWPLMNALQKILLCFKKASNFKTSKGHVNASHYMFSLHFDKGEETKYRFSELNCLFNYLINISLKIKQKQFNCIGMMQAMIMSEYAWLFDCCYCRSCCQMPSFIVNNNMVWIIDKFRRNYVGNSILVILSTKLDVVKSLTAEFFEKFRENYGITILRDSYNSN